MYEPGTSGQPESVNGSRYTVCAVAVEGAVECSAEAADVVILTIFLARDCIL
jgi:hypothetical protein